LSQAEVKFLIIGRLASLRKAISAPSSDKPFGFANLGDLAALPAKHSFVDALAELIASASTGSLEKLIAASKDGWVPHIEVFGFTRAIRGRIRIAGLPDEFTASVEYVPTALGIKPRRARKIDPSRTIGADGGLGDLEQSRRVTERTILPIARLFSAESGSE
jgi:hypothetical protein